MKIVIKTKNIKLNSALEDFIESKINDLEKFSKIFQQQKYFNEYFGRGKPKAEAWVEIEKSTHHKKGPFFRAECQMRLPGKSLRAVARSADFKMAIVKIKDELQRQLKQYKEKLISKTKRRQRVFKKEIRLSPRARFYRKGRIKEEGV